MTYVELHAHSAYSFLDGASQPEELAVCAAELGYEALALTDHDGVYGSLERAAAAASTSTCSGRMSAATRAATRACVSSRRCSAFRPSRREMSTRTTAGAPRCRTSLLPSAAVPRSRAASASAAVTTRR